MINEHNLHVQASELVQRPLKLEKKTVSEAELLYQGQSIPLYVGSLSFDYITKILHVSYFISSVATMESNYIYFGISLLELKLNKFSCWTGTVCTCNILIFENVGAPRCFCFHRTSLQY